MNFRIWGVNFWKIWGLWPPWLLVLAGSQLAFKSLLLNCWVLKSLRMQSVVWIPASSFLSLNQWIEEETSWSIVMVWYGSGHFDKKRNCPRNENLHFPVEEQYHALLIPYPATHLIRFRDFSIQKLNSNDPIDLKVSLISLEKWQISDVSWTNSALCSDSWKNLMPWIEYIGICWYNLFLLAL